MSYAPKAGGADFVPGAPNTLTITGLSSTESSASFRCPAYPAISVSGTHGGGGSWAFTFTANESGVFDPTPGRFDCQVVYGSGKVEPVALQTGERAIGTEPSDPGAATRVSSITAGTGITCTPNPITSTGTIAANLALGGLTNVGSGADSASAGEVLEYQSGAWGPQAKRYIPDPSEGGVAVGKKKIGSVTKTLYLRTFYQAYDTGSGPTGNVTLWASSGIDPGWTARGNVTTSTGNAVSDGFYSRMEVYSNGSVVLTRNSGYNVADSGYYYELEYTLSSDSGS